MCSLTEHNEIDKIVSWGTATKTQKRLRFHVVFYGLENLNETAPAAPESLGYLGKVSIFDRLAPRTRAFRMSYTGVYTRHSADYFRRLRLNVLFFAIRFFALPRTRAFLADRFFLAGLAILFGVPRIRAFLTDGFFLAGLAIVLAVPRTRAFLADRFFLTGLATVS